MYDSVTGATTVGSSVSYVSDRNNKASSAINFNSVPVQIASCPNANQIYSLVFWINTPSYPSTLQFIIEYFDTATQHFQDPFALLLSGSTIYFWESSTVFLTGTIPLNTWTHVGITQDGTYAYLYLNSVQIATATHPVSNSNTNGNFASTGYPCVASIDDLAFYNRLLTAQEILVWYNNAI